MEQQVGQVEPRGPRGALRKEIRAEHGEVRDIAVEVCLELKCYNVNGTASLCLTGLLIKICFSNSITIKLKKGQRPVYALFICPFCAYTTWPPDKESNVIRHIQSKHFRHVDLQHRVE